MLSGKEGILNLLLICVLEYPVNLFPCCLSDLTCGLLSPSPCFVSFFCAFLQMSSLIFFPQNTNLLYQESYNYKLQRPNVN